ncbi:Zinc finger protein 830 [Thelohanellus kitauei]|uniref:Zinc finger protein 830 n=1 Tax=Thelohanellus kitauei TaxID=669202 RepID=A0A0C2MJ70_THEKT|nr:Zinc finger protein 830 [Thelohanellus kitauei]
MSFKSEFRAEIAKLETKRKTTQNKPGFKEPSFHCSTCRTSFKTRSLLNAHFQTDNHKNSAILGVKDESGKFQDLKTRKRKAEVVDVVPESDQLSQPTGDYDGRFSTVVAQPKLHIPIIEPKIISNIDTTDEVPEGFFDDPHQDAKARNVPYVDKFEDLFSKFKEEIKDDLKATDQMFEQNWEDTEISRDENELSRMESCVKRMFDLRENVDRVLHDPKTNSSAANIDEHDESNESGSESDYIMGWRNKNPFNT